MAEGRHWTRTHMEFRIDKGIITADYGNYVDWIEEMRVRSWTAAIESAGHTCPFLMAYSTQSRSFAWRNQRSRKQSGNSRDWRDRRSMPIHSFTGRIIADGCNFFESYFRQSFSNDIILSILFNYAILSAFHDDDSSTGWSDWYLGVKTSRFLYQQTKATKTRWRGETDSLRFRKAHGIITYS